MSTLNNVKKRMGRPFVESEPVTVRLLKTDIAEIDNWRKTEPDLPGRPEAIRRLVRKGLGK